MDRLAAELASRHPENKVVIKTLDVNDHDQVFQIFRESNDGHLVTVSSMSAMRGMPGSVTTYAATKAGLAALTEGIRADLMRTPIKVTTLFPGYIIESEMNANATCRSGSSLAGRDGATRRAPAEVAPAATERERSDQ